MRLMMFICLAEVLLSFPSIAADRNLVMSVEEPKGSSVTSGDFDKMADNAETVARTKNSSADVPCDIRIVRSGDIVQNQTLPKEITTKAQLDKISSLPVDVFVMDQLSVCGKYVNQPAVTGCDRDGPILVEAGTLAYLTLIHETGHKTGLHHTTSTALCEEDPGLTLAPVNKKNNILFCRRHIDRMWMTASDCDAIRSTSHFADDQADLDGQIAVAENGGEGELPSISPTQALISSLFEEGIAFEAILSLTSQQLDAIRAELQGNDSRFWEQSAYILGIRGDAQDLESIVALAHRAAGILSAEGYRARSAVPEAIGLYLAYHKASPNLDWAKAFLLSNVSTNGIRMLGSEDEIPLLANRYAQGTALTGDLGLAQSALDILSAQGATAEVQESVAARALASETALPQAVIQGDVPMAPNAIDILRGRARELQIQIDPYLVDILLREGLYDSTIVERFNQLEFGPGAIDIDQLDQRVQELMLENSGTE